MIFDDLKDRAIAEFDRLAAEKLREAAEEMLRSGMTPDEITGQLMRAVPDIAAQRARIAGIVQIELMRLGLPAGGEAK